MEDKNEIEELSDTRGENLAVRVMKGIFISAYLWNKLVIAVLIIATILGVIYTYL